MAITTRALPTISRPEDLVTYLKRWEQGLRPLTRAVRQLPAPFDFTATVASPTTTVISLSWHAVTGADGYEVMWTENGDFSENVNIIPIEGGTSVKYDFAAGAVGITRYFQLRATSGRQGSAPHVGKGRLTGVLKAQTGTAGSSGDGQTSDQGNSGGGRGGPIL